MFLVFCKKVFHRSGQIVWITLSFMAFAAFSLSGSKTVKVAETVSEMGEFRQKAQLREVSSEEKRWSVFENDEVYSQKANKNQADRLHLVLADKKDRLVEKNIESIGLSRRPARKKAKRVQLKKEGSFHIPVVKRRKLKKKKLNLKAVRPPTLSRVYYEKGTDEAELESLYNEEIKHLFKIVKQNPDPDLFLRLGSLYVEKARFITFKIHGDYESRMSDFEQGRRQTKPYLNLKSAHVYNKKALKLFTNFIRQYPKHARKDEVLFFLGFTSYQLGQEASGSNYFAQLEKEFPKSIKLYEARFQMAEYYFRNSKWSLAYNYYSRVARNRRGKFYFLSLYKMAWSSYKMAQSKRALKLLARVISEGKIKANVKSEIKNLTFVEEAIGDLAFFYSYSNSSSANAPDFFYSLLGRKKGLPELKKLAYNYRDIGDTKGVIHLFTHLIEEDPTGPSAFEYKHQIVQILYDAGRTQQIFKHIREWLRDYGYDSHWAKANSDNVSLVRRANQLIEVTLRGYALNHNKSFRRTKSNRAKVMALNFYRLYFTNFKASKFSHEMRFFYGDLLFDTGDYKRAALQYEQLIKKFPSSKYIKPAYLNQLLAMEKLLPPSSQVDKLTARKKEAPVSFPDSIGKFIAVSRRYLKKFPNQKNSSTVLYHVAAFYYNFNRFDKAALYFRQLFDAYPASSHISTVGGILLDLYNKNKDYKALEELAVKFANNKNTDGKLIEEAKFILQQLDFTKAQNLALQGKFKKSAILYEKFAKKHPSSSLAALALFNAGINYEKHKDIKKAVSMYSSVLTYKNKKSLEMRNQANEFLPVLYEKLGFYRKAAQGYASYAVNFPGSQKAIPYWYNASVIHDAFNQVSSAVKAYNKYYNLSKSADRHEVLYLMGLLYERNRNRTKAIAYFDRYIKTPVAGKGDALKKVRASFKIAEIYQYRLKDIKKARYWHRNTIALHKKLGAGTSYAASSHFVIAREAYKKFLAVRIPSQPAAQKKAVNQKIALLKRLEQELKPVIRYDDGEQLIASLALIGLANEKMAEAIYRVPLPKGLNKAGRAQYREGIKQVITPYAKAAVKSYQLALEKVEKLKIYSDWVEVAFKGLHTVKLNEKGFLKFDKAPVIAEVMDFQVLDEAGTAADSFLEKLSVNLKSNVSKKELERITVALNKGQEQKMLSVISGILNRDPDHLLAINSLALFYLKNRKPGVARLIVNRVLSKHPRQTALINNLGIIALSAGDIRQAILHFKQVLSIDSRNLIARVNLGNIFLKIKDYGNAYSLLKGAYDQALSEWGSKSSRPLKVLNNYGVALIGKNLWKPALQVFNKLSKKLSSSKEVIFNRAIVLTNGFRDKKFRKEAKGLVDELSFYSNSVNFNKKLNRLLAVIKE